jgi:hypothetical protein
LVSLFLPLTPRGAGGSFKVSDSLAIPTSQPAIVIRESIVFWKPPSCFVQPRFRQFGGGEGARIGGALLSRTAPSAVHYDSEHLIPPRSVTKVDGG